MSGGGTNITLKTNDVANTVQSELNLKAGTNMTLIPDGNGGVTLNAGGGPETQNLQAVTDIGAETSVATTFYGGILTDMISSIASNPISFGVNGDQSIVTNSIKDSSANVSVDVFNKALYSNGSEMVNWNNQTLFYSGFSRISWSSMDLLRGNNVSVFNWDLGLLYWNNGVQHAIADLSSQRLYDMTDQTSIDWGARLAYASNGSTVIMNYNNSTGARFGASIQVGRTDTAPVSAIHVDKGNATASQLKFTAGTTTGLTATDGFDIGITTTGVAEIRQYESQPIRFYTANVNYVSFLSGEPTILLDSQGSNSVNAGKVIYRTVSGSESFTTTFNASDNRFYFLYGATTVGSVTSTGWGFGITAFAPSATIHAIAIGEQFRAGYDASNYSNSFTSSVGKTTFNSISATNVGEFVFSKGIALPYVAKTATYTTTVQDYTVDCTTGTYTINLVTAVGNTGKIFVIKNTGGGTITVDASGTETIDGALTVTLATYQSVTVQSTGVNWIII